MARFTPGPWRVNGCAIEDSAKRTSCVASVYDSVEEFRHNAKLIAAAPDMAGALLNCLDELRGRHTKHVDVGAVERILVEAGVL